VTRLAIVIVSFNAREDLARALASLRSAPPRASYTIVVVDNGSTDGATDLVRTQFPEVRLIEAGDNLGFGRANNLGIRETRSDYVLLLNPDTIVPAGAVDALSERLDADPSITAVGPRLVDGRGRAELSFGAMYSPWTEARRKMALALDAGGIGPVRRWIERATRTPREPDWLTGACLMVRRSAGDAVGWFDERFFMYAEDVDLCAALRANGGRLVFAPDVEVAHLRGRSGLTRPGPTRDAWRASHLAFYEKHRPGWAPLLRLYLRLTR
jgi:GT2 family glycosyltransferase